MPRALQDRMGVRAADSSSILGKAKGTHLWSQEEHGQPNKGYPSRAPSVHRPQLAPPRDHSPSGIPVLKSFPGHCSQSRDHHTQPERTGCPWTRCPHHSLLPGYLAGSSAWAAPQPSEQGWDVGCMTPWAADFPTASLAN